MMAASEESSSLPKGEKAEEENSSICSASSSENQNWHSDRQDEPDGNCWHLGNKEEKDKRPQATMPVGHAKDYYNMHHKRRGMAVILAYSEYAGDRLPSRISAPHDVGMCKKAFQKLGYEVTIHWDLSKRAFLNELDQVRKANHDDCDSLLVTLLSHGGVRENTNIEYIETYDARVDTIELWKNFTPDKCPTLAGKPKMFFIQACRGKKTDKGVHLQNLRGLPVQVDAIPISNKKEPDYAIPLYADMLVMWASYQESLAFNTYGDGISGSVFLHYLAEILTTYANQEDLFSMLLRLTREVAIQYEAYRPKDDSLHQSKQIPQMVSTLMRKVRFFEK